MRPEGIENSSAQNLLQRTCGDTTGSDLPANANALARIRTWITGSEDQYSIH